MLSFVVCDDNKIILEKISKILESIFIQNNIDARVTYASTSPDEIYKYSKENKVDVFLLDIDLKDKISGIDLANNIREFNRKAYIIFLSAHLEYILIAYKCKTFDFIPKPITIERVEETILRLMEDINSNTKNKHFIQINNKKEIINQDNINFIKKDRMKLIFYTDTSIYESYGSFNKISNDLPNNFIRCHKSYIANLNKISNIDYKNNYINFNNDTNNKCFIGPKYKNNLMEGLRNDRSYADIMD